MKELREAAALYPDPAVASSVRMFPTILGNLLQSQLECHKTARHGRSKSLQVNTGRGMHISQEIERRVAAF